MSILIQTFKQRIVDKIGAGPFIIESIGQVKYARRLAGDFDCRMTAYRSNIGWRVDITERNSVQNIRGRDTTGLSFET
jgi:hypothetical protein